MRRKLVSLRLPRSKWHRRRWAIRPRDRQLQAHVPSPSGAASSRSVWSSSFRSRPLLARSQLDQARLFNIKAHVFFYLLKIQNYNAIEDKLMDAVVIFL
jgi:hypothetical protein